jgi:hypothetical protein
MAAQTPALILLDIGSVLGGIALAVVAFVVVILVCVVILRLLAAILPSYEERDAARLAATLAPIADAEAATEAPISHADAGSATEEPASVTDAEPTTEAPVADTAEPGAKAAGRGDQPGE